MQNKDMSADPNRSLPHSLIDQVYDLGVSSTTQTPKGASSGKMSMGTLTVSYFVT